jgi:NAD(P)-dependent dehydrogenase (short-subunit alcohol dehydrogenase family)
MTIKNLTTAFEVKGKNALITGGSQGLGQAMAEAYAELGANVGITGRNAEKGAKTAKEIEAKFPGSVVKFYQADHREQADSQRVVDDFVADFGKIDVLINNAGAGAGADALDFYKNGFADWKFVLDLDLTGMFMMCVLAANKMKDTGGGSIINITSNASVVVNKPQHMVAYSVAKAGANHMTRMLAWEWSEYKIRLNAIAPGYFNTALAEQRKEEEADKTENLLDLWLDMTPTGRFGEPIEVAALSVYLGSEASEQMTGEIIVIDGGYQLAN